MRRGGATDMIAKIRHHIVEPRRGRSDPSEEPTAAPGPAADHLGGAQGACKVSDRQRNASLSGIASKLEGGALDEITRKECARGRTSAASQLLGTQNRH